MSLCRARSGACAVACSSLTAAMRLRSALGAESRSRDGSGAGGLWTESSLRLSSSGDVAPRSGRKVGVSDGSRLGAKLGWRLAREGRSVGAQTSDAASVAIGETAG